MGSKTTKHSYTITCSSAFRDAVAELAGRRRVNVADLARSVVLMVPPETVLGFPDPGEPDPGDRETVVLKSGAAKGRPWQRKPRLQVRLMPGFEVAFLRRALALALAMDEGETEVRLEAANDRPAEPDTGDAEELDRLRAIISVLSFDPLSEGVTSRDEALHVLGFPPGTAPAETTLKARFRTLAAIHHPDSGYGSHNRMSQLNAAMDVLRGAAVAD